MPEGCAADERDELGGREVAVCVATFYRELAERMVGSAIKTFADAGVSPTGVHVYEVPGAFELPVAAKWCAESGRFYGVACLGAVIRGETSHYDHVCTAAARGVQEVGLRTGVPCAFGLITADSMEQAEARAGGEKRDQGRDAATAVMRMSLVRTAVSGKR